MYRTKNSELSEAFSSSNDLSCFILLLRWKLRLLENLWKSFDSFFYLFCEKETGFFSIDLFFEVCKRLPISWLLTMVRSTGPYGTVLSVSIHLYGTVRSRTSNKISFEFTKLRYAGGDLPYKFNRFGKKMQNRLDLYESSFIVQRNFTYSKQIPFVVRDRTEPCTVPTSVRSVPYFAPYF